MIFKVLNREKAVLQSKRLVTPHAIISVTDPDSDPADLCLENRNCLGTIRLQFHDLDERHLEFLEDGRYKDLILFDQTHARQILTFVDSIKSKVGLIVVHCEAGISRSAGIAAALSKIINGDDAYFFNRFIPNRLVYSTILEMNDDD